MLGVPKALVAWAPTILFIVNLTGPPTHLWTIAVEFQMYILSPLYIKWAYKNPTKTFAATMGAIVVSITMALSIFFW